MCKGPVMGENMVYLRNRSTLSERKKGRGTKMRTDSKRVARMRVDLKTMS